MKPLGLFLILITCMISIAAMAFAVVTAGTFRDRLHFHTQKWQRAEVYLSSPHCREGGKRSKLGEFQLCDESEKILSSSPLFHAVVDVSKKIPPVLAQCTSALRQDLHRVALTVGIMVLVWMWIKKYLAPTPSVDTSSFTYSHQTLPVWRPRSLPTFTVVHDY